MKSGALPSSHAFVRGSAELDIQRGNLRDGLAALRNLAQLLHSLRVGSRPIANVLPGARDACDPLRHAMGEILAAVQSALGEQAAGESLSGYAEPRISELEAALTAASVRTLSVKTRLSLEETVTRLSQELDVARGLFDLLVDSLSGRAVRLDVLELSRQSFAGPASGSWPRETVIATLKSEAQGLEIEVNPRVVTALIALGVELVAHPRDPSQVPHIRIGANERGACQITIERNPRAGGEDLLLLRRGVIAPTLPCAIAAARASGGTLAFDPAVPRVSLTFDQSFLGRTSGEAG